VFCRALRHVHHRRCHSFALVFSLTGQLVSTNIASGAHALTEERVVVIAKEAVIKVPWAPKSLHLPDPLHAARTTTTNLHHQPLSAAAKPNLRTYQIHHNNTQTNKEEDGGNKGEGPCWMRQWRE